MTPPASSTRARSRARRDDGQAYVEFALILPVLLLVVMGIIQFGTAFKDYIALTDAVRVGARQGAVSRSIVDPTQRVPLIVAKTKGAAGTLDTSKMVITVKPWDPDLQHRGLGPERRRHGDGVLPVQGQPLRHRGLRQHDQQPDDGTRGVGVATCLQPLRAPPFSCPARQTAPSVPRVTMV